MFFVAVIFMVEAGRSSQSLFGKHEKSMYLSEELKNNLVLTVKVKFIFLTISPVTPLFGPISAE